MNILLAPIPLWVALFAAIILLCATALLILFATRNKQNILQERLLQRDELADDLKSAAVRVEQELKEKSLELLGLHRQVSELQRQVLNDKEKIKEFHELEEKFVATFKALSADTLANTNKSFLELAEQKFKTLHEEAKGELTQRKAEIETLVTPIKDSLAKVDVQITTIEKTRIESFAKFEEQVRGLVDTQKNLKDETANLVRALRKPNVRGRWGEIQLRRVVELAGMLEYCDFLEQSSVDSERGKLRPDLTIQLPGGKVIVVDSKAPLDAYLEAIEAPEDSVRDEKMALHAAQVRKHLQQLSQKSYWEQFPSTPEFVVLFLPGETFFSAALEKDPTLIEAGVEQRVILATPTTLIALLRAVAYGWRQEQLSKNAQVISALGRDLYERIRVFAKHFVDMKKSLEGTTHAYNKAVASLESRVLVGARKLHELGAGSVELIPESSPIEIVPRELAVDVDRELN